MEPIVHIPMIKRLKCIFVRILSRMCIALFSSQPSAARRVDRHVHNLKDRSHNRKLSANGMQVFNSITPTVLFQDTY